MAFEINSINALILSILVLYLGYFLKSRLHFLKTYSIPVSVAGGFLFSLFAAVLAGLGILTLTIDLELRSFLLLIFFSTIGLNAKFSELANGGKALLLLVIACSICLIIQNIIGISVVTALGKDPYFGLFGGSISLAGGHGTAIAWGEIVADKGIKGISEFGLACATMGLVLGGIFGGPIATRLIEKHDLRPSPETRGMAQQKVATSQGDEPKKHKVSVEIIIDTVFVLALCIVIGDAVNRFLFNNEILLPGFLTAMFAGVVMANVTDMVEVDINKEGLDLTGGVCLQLFLSMSLMSMDLLSMAESALLLMLVITAQLIFAMVFASFIVFRMMGKDYDAAVVAGGFFGLTIGATPVAIASMDAASKKHGPSYKALLIIPLVGAFFVDLINAGTIDVFLRLPLFN
ncbi:sodium/glutamate symporter [Oceanicoccus sagamiensis]|uniref:Sodium/glutamate symporter n=1 Tax=Oceanicoccus sagamiensis TaxID=716816 RepID=A0A1X9ND22_9GAMM|nr:sodium/glutamate symporter [Oceanicoccus sagamiensis]ARN72857.1 sodium/glutamate symporter [Oceanicoccus sagamiensis]